MARKKNIGKIKKFAQSCDSRTCRSNHRDEIIKGFSEAVTTVHEYDSVKNTVTCFECGKVTKLTS